MPSKTLSSIYFGGGSPSILESEEIKAILDSLKNHYTWDENCELTLEANPDDISVSKCAAWASAGINRLSIGIQSFDDTDLAFMNRAHNAREAQDCINIAKDAGIENLSIDLIYGSESTTQDIWAKNIHQALSLEVAHISSYCLTIEEGTALASFVKRGLAKDLDDEKALIQFHYLIDQLGSAGYEHYEISNFALSNQLAIHNSNYWLGQPYLGIGPSAHSFDGSSRQWNIAHNPKYIQALESGKIPFTMETLSPLDQYNEYVLIRLRTKWGCDLGEIRSQFPNYEEHFLQASLPLLEEGLIQEVNGSIKLSKPGKFQADRISMELMGVG